MSNSSTGSSGTSSSLDMTSLSLDVNTGAGTQQGSGTSVVAGGDATAVGENTYASASVVATAESNSAGTQSYASADFEASGTGSPDTLVYATTTSFAEQAGSADQVWSFNYTSSNLHQDGEASTWSSTSVSEVNSYDLNIGGATQATGAAVPDYLDASAAPAPTVADGWGAVDTSYVAGGNLAVFYAYAEASGENSIVEVDLSALTVADELSSVTALAYAGVG